MLDSFMKQAGFPKEARSKEGRWIIGYGSVRGAVEIIDMDGDPALRANAAVIPIPSDTELILPLFRELLLLNDSLPGSARLSLRGGKIWVQATRAIKEIKPGDCPRIIHEVMSLADDLDEELIKKYGGTTRVRKARTGVSGHD